MKIFVIVSLISSIAFAAAATCDVSNSSSSVDQLVTLANNNLSVTREITGEDDGISEKDALLACRMINLANRSTKDPYTEFMKVIGIVIKKKKLSIDNPTKFAFDNLDKLICKNNDTTKMQKSNTILKYALDTANYDFIRSAIFIKKDGKNVCNPYIDFKHRSPMDVTDPASEKESLVEFIDKILNKDGMDAAHDFGSIRDIRTDIIGCEKDQDA